MLFKYLMKDINIFLKNKVLMNLNAKFEIQDAGAMEYIGETPF